MKRILFLLLLTVSVYGQNPSRFAKIQITGNSNSGTATKVNVQEANGEVNTQTINTGFNKNIGLGGSDVVGANTLLNQYATTPSDWTAQSYVLNSVVFYGGKQWIAKIATVAGDVPSVSSKWEEITFQALANKTTTVDQTIIDGSTNAVSGNAVFDGLALKSNIGHTHVASQITDLSKASVGLGNVDNTSDLSKPLSTATQTALNGKENSFTKNTAFNKNFGTTAGTVAGGNDSRIDNGQTAFSWGNHASAGYALTTGLNINQASFRTALGLGTNAYTSTAYLPLSGGTLTGILSIDGVDSPKIFFRQNSSLISLITNNFGIYGTGSKTDFNTFVYGNNPYGIWTNGEKRVTVGGDGSTTFSGTVTASPATTENQVPTWGQVQAITKPYKVYTALLTQTGTNAPVATVLENTLGGTVTFERAGVGNYNAVSVGNLFTLDKTVVFNSSGQFVGTYNFYPSNTSRIALNNVNVSGVVADSLMQKLSIEIRVYL